MVAYRSPRVHPASMVPADQHDPILLDLIESNVSRPVIDYAVQFTRDTVDYALSRSGPSTSKRTSFRGRTQKRPAEDAFHTMVVRVLGAAEVQMPTLLVALLYVDRARPYLQIALEQWACERVFLGALMLASKYCNDSTLKNVHWAWATGTFGKADMARIEREFLDVLNWDLAVREAELLPFQQHLADLALDHSSPKRGTKRSLARSPTRSHKHRATTPELSSPSSSTSSVASTSPRTPHSHDAEPRYPPGIHIPADTLEPSTGKHRSARPARPRRSGTLDILLHFPVPRARKTCKGSAAVAAVPHQAPQSSAVWI